MTTRQVVFAPEAEDQLDDLHRYIAAAATAEVADRYVGQVIDDCEDLVTFPIRGATRSALGPTGH